MLQIHTFKDSEEICAVAVGKSSPDYVHCGILYSSELEGHKVTFFLHLGNPIHLSNDSEKDDLNNGYLNRFDNFFWNPFLNVPNQLLKLIRTKCSLIAKKNSALPYGIFHDEKTEFDAEGNFRLGTDASGFTCATFVKVVLKGCGIDVLDDTDWPDEREEDLHWLEKLIIDYKDEVKNLQKKVDQISLEITKIKAESQNMIRIQILSGAKNYNLKKIKVFNNCIKELNEGIHSAFKRYRPEELSAASYNSSELFPIKFNYPDEPEKMGAEEMGIELLTAII